MQLAISLALCATGLASLAQGYGIQKTTSLNCRTEPSTDGTVVRKYAASDDVALVCQTSGESVQGNDIWDKTTDGCYVADYYVHTGSNGYVAQKCGSSNGANKCGGSNGSGTDTPADTPTDAPTDAPTDVASNTDSDDSSSSDSGDDDNSGSSIPGPVVDDYPYSGNCNTVDRWWYYTCECTSFAAWRINSRLGIDFDNHYKGPNWGNANTWDDAARKTGVPINDTPVPGCIAQTDAGHKGHVAWVTKVTSSSVTVEEYNYVYHHKYSTRTLPRSTFKYIHLKV